MQFPVSSGQHHRANESEWVPVSPPKPAKKDKEPQEQQPAITITKPTISTVELPNASKNDENKKDENSNQTAIELPTAGINVQMNAQAHVAYL